MFQSKKKPGLAVVIGVGKPKDPDAPESLERPAKKPRMSMSRDMHDSDMHDSDMEMGEDHESAESPEYEAREEYGGELIAAIESAGEQHGLSPEESRAVAADFFSAVARHLQGEEEDQAA